MDLQRIAHGIAYIALTADDCAFLGNVCLEANHHLFGLAGDEQKQMLLSTLGVAFASLALAVEATNMMTPAKQRELFSVAQLLGLTTLQSPKA